MAAVTFATGAYAVHGANFYQIVRGMSMKEAGTSIGLLTAIAGLLGIALGTFLADLLYKLTHKAYLLLASCTVACAVPLGIYAILQSDRGLSLTASRRDDPLIHGARPVQHGDRQRGAGQSQHWVMRSISS